MDIEINPLYVPIITSNCRYYHLWGGRSRGGSHFATDYFLWKMTQPDYFRGAMLRSTMKEITQSLWVALQKRIKTATDKGDLDERDIKININEHTITYIPTGNVIICKGFRATSSSSVANLKGLEGITHAIVEEAQDVYEDDFTDLDATLRTTEVENIQIFVLFNPPGKKHWLIRRNYNLIPLKKYPGWYQAVQKDIPELMSIHSNYKDNALNINKATKKLYESKGDPSHPSYDLDYYLRDVLGFISEGKKGRIFLNVKPITIEFYNKVPIEEKGGLDFGFNDPVALGGIKYDPKTGNIFVRQIVYKKGLDNDELVSEMKEAGIKRDMRIYGDCAEPKSIKTINKYGYNIIPVDKYPGSIEHRYRLLLNCNIYIVDSSKDLWNEFEEHSWRLDPDKNPTDKPEDRNNHLLDGIMYCLSMITDGSSVSSARAEDYYEENDGRENYNSITRERLDERRGIDEEDEEDFNVWLYGGDGR